jgi:uncharacterized protein (TIGR02246 family)
VNLWSSNLWATSLAGLASVALVAAIATGCSSSTKPMGTRLESQAAEPDLPASRKRSKQPMAAVVPVVVRQPKAFRAVDGAQAAAENPSGLKWTSYPAAASLPSRIATGAGGTVRLTAGEEPAHLEPQADTPLVAEIRDMLTGYLRAFNHHDACAAAAHWAPAAENVNLDSGEVTAGREAVQAVFATLFASEPAASIDIDVSSIRPLRDDVAVIDGVSRVAYADGEVISSRFVAVAARHEGTWMLESVREAAAAKVEATPRPIDELAWLVGRWENVGHGVIAGARCDWAPGRAYLVRCHTVQPADVPADRPRAGDAAIPGLLPAGGTSARELTEVIAWDPERQEIRSWIFSSDGRFAEATWRRDGQAWTIAVEGRGADTGRVATCTLLPGGGDSHGGIDAWEYRCEGTGLESLMPPACGFARTSR